MQRRVCWIAVALAFAAMDDRRGQAAEPDATFTLNQGWVEVALQQDGRPLANAKIDIIDENGGKFGDGETLEDGRAAFPAPPGSWFVVEIKSGARTADPIRLFKNNASVEPARVLLSYGLRPCCRSIKPAGDAITTWEQREAAPSGANADPWNYLVPGLAGVSITAMVLFMVWHR